MQRTLTLIIVLLTLLVIHRTITSPGISWYDLHTCTDEETWVINSAISYARINMAGASVIHELTWKGEPVDLNTTLQSLNSAQFVCGNMETGMSWQASAAANWLTDTIYLNVEDPTFLKFEQFTRNGSNLSADEVRRMYEPSTKHGTIYGPTDFVGLLMHEGEHLNHGARSRHHLNQKAKTRGLTVEIYKHDLCYSLGRAYAIQAANRAYHQ
jgi:hypothetical protein